MLQRFAYGFLLLAGGLLSSGCCSMSHYGACGGGGGCDSCGDVGVGYETCGECQPGLCHHPWLWTRAKNALTCGAGCGDVYCGEWISDPPACGDPCDACGETSCGGCDGYYGCWNPLQGLAHLWGYRYAAGGCDAGCDVGYDEGCDSCAASYETLMPEEMPVEAVEEVEEVEEAEEPEKAEKIERKLPAPKPAAEPQSSKQASAKGSGRTVKIVPASHKTSTFRRK